MARTLFTGRHGGFSTGSFESFNLGDHVGDDAEVVTKNRDLVQKIFSVDQLIFMAQSHGSNIVEIVSGLESTAHTDALITRVKGIGLAVLVADCLPVLLSSPTTVAAVHVGRRGLLDGILQKVIHRFPADEKGSIKAEIGPRICTHCYEVDIDTYRDAISLVPELATDESLHQLDLIAGALAILRGLNVEVTHHDICTKEDTNYFSFRRANISGRQAGLIAL